MSIAQKQKCVDGKWQIWRPFFAWKRGRSKDPIVLGLTEAEVSLIQWTLNRIGSCPGVQLGKAERQNVPICNRILDRRNLRPLAGTERGAIHSD